MKSYKSWIKDKENSIAAIDKNKYHIIDALGGGEIHSIEKENNKILQLLDRDCGIDLIWVRGKKARWIASRVQWGIRHFDTFTIRYKRKSGTKTEYEKRLESIKEEFIYPQLTMQMYCNNEIENKFESMAIIKTRDLYSLPIIKPDLFHESKSNNFFKYIHWDDIRNETDISILIKRREEKLDRRDKIPTLIRKQGTLF